MYLKPILRKRFYLNFNQLIINTSLSTSLNFLLFYLCFNCESTIKPLLNFLFVFVFKDKKYITHFVFC